jgi:hypothetical protein
VKFGLYPSLCWCLIYCVCSPLLSDFCSKAEVLWPVDGQVVPARAEVVK